MKKIAVALCALLIAVVLWSVLHDRPKSTPLRVKADKVLVWKKKREMQLIHQGKVIRQYAISLGASPVGHKQQEGDERTPEGSYLLDWRNSRSTCYKSIHVSYPNPLDQQQAKRLGISPGGSIMVHGLANGLGWLGRLHTWKDWTNGCVAVTNEEMDEIWGAVPNGTPIEIKP